MSLRLERLVERERGVLRRRVDRRRADLGHGVERTSGSGRESAGCRARQRRAREIVDRVGRSSRMHLKWPSGHSRLKHGLHAMSIFAILRERRQRRRVDGRRRAEQRDQRHADRRGRVHQARVVADDDARPSDRRSIAVPRSVRAGQVAHRAAGRRPATAAPRRRRACRSASRRSTRRRPSRRNSRASSAKWFGGQRLAGPNSAPGHRIATGAVGFEPQRAHRAASRLAASGTSTGARRHAARSAPGGTASAAKRSTSRGSALRSSRRAIVEQAVARFARVARCASECARGTAPAPTSRSWAARTRARSLRSRSSRASARRSRQVELAVRERRLDDRGGCRACARRPARTTAAPARRRSGPRTGSRSSATSGSDRIASPTQRRRDDQDAFARSAIAASRGATRRQRMRDARAAFSARALRGPPAST